MTTDQDKATGGRIERATYIDRTQSNSALKLKSENSSLESRSGENLEMETENVSRGGMDIPFPERLEVNWGSLPSGIPVMRLSFNLYPYVWESTMCLN